MARALRSLSTIQVLRRWWQPFDSLAVISSSGAPIDVKYQLPSDLGTLSLAAEICSKYFTLQDGDVILTTDPYSGGSILSNLTFVARVIPPKAAAAGALSIVSQIPLKPWVSLGTSLNEEGLRIPPTPILQAGQLNHPLIEAMAAHPLSPKEFGPAVEKMLALLRMKILALKKQLECKAVDFSDRTLANAERISREVFLRSVESLASGTISKVVRLEDGSRLKLNLEHAEDQFRFDFSGTSESTQYSMTDAATLGACTAAVLATSGRAIPVNNGLLSFVKITAPKGSLVHAQFPQPVFRGMTEGVFNVANLALNAICEIKGNNHLPVHGISPCAFTVEFPDGRKFFDSLEPGTAASKNESGEEALNIWKRTNLRPSIEEIERRFPLLIRSSSLRAKSGGSGQYPGGNGSTKVIEFLSDAKVNWLTSQEATKPSGVEGGKTAHGPEVALYRQGKRENLPSSGIVSVEAGDSFVMHSPGGGGYGEV